MDKNPTVPKGVFIAGAHTHGAYSENAYGEVFSDSRGDEGWAKAAKGGEGVSLYLLTPSGFLYKFDPQKHKSGERDEIANNMPYDLDVPNIQLTRKSNKSYTGKGYRKK